jgi:HEAT repeat protein
VTRLVEFLGTGEESWRTAAAGALDGYLTALPEGDPRAAQLGETLLGLFARSEQPVQRTILGLLPNILKRTGNTLALQCQQAVITGLKMPDSEDRLLSIRLALHPELKVRKELLPLVNDPAHEVRVAALFGVAAVSDAELAVPDEEIFRFLHDPDEGVRKVCTDVLVSRNRSDVEINLARRLSSPEPAERLKLLFDLRYEDDVLDPEPWLERLSRDRDPAVRVGAARVILEVTADRKQTCPGWVLRVTDADPDPTVRRVASFFRREMLSRSGIEVKQASYP